MARNIRIAFCYPLEKGQAIDRDSREQSARARDGSGDLGAN